MKNLDIAIKSSKTDKVKEADKLVELILQTKKSDGRFLRYDLLDFTYGIARSISGYSKGSEIFDNGDITKVMSLLGISFEESEDSSLNYDDFEFHELNQAYANEVMGAYEEFDFSTLDSFKTLLKEIEDLKLDITSDNLKDMFKYSSKIKDELYEYLTSPRG